MKPLAQEELRDAISEILDDFGHDVVNDRGASSREFLKVGAKKELLDLFNSQLQAREAEWESNFIETKLDNLVTIRAISELEEARNAGFKSNSPSSQSNWIVNRLIELRNQVKPTVAQIMDDPKTFDVAAKGMMDKRNDLLREQVK